jgi:hypothetical protein
MSSTTTVTSLPRLGSAQQVLHQHGIGAGTIDGHLDRDHLWIVGCLLQQLDYRIEGLERVVYQDVMLADAGKNVVALGQHLGQAGLERWIA